jgi:hypothetical protein
MLQGKECQCGVLWRRCCVALKLCWMLSMERREFVFAAEYFNSTRKKRKNESALLSIPSL